MSRERLTCAQCAASYTQPRRVSDEAVGRLCSSCRRGVAHTLLRLRLAIDEANGTLTLHAQGQAPLGPDELEAVYERLESLWRAYTDTTKAGTK